MVGMIWITSGKIISITCSTSSALARFITVFHSNTIDFTIQTWTAPPENEPNLCTKVTTTLQ